MELFYNPIMKQVDSLISTYSLLDYPDSLCYIIKPYFQPTNKQARKQTKLNQTNQTTTIKPVQEFM